MYVTFGHSDLTVNKAHDMESGTQSTGRSLEEIPEVIRRGYTVY
jgi:hypothetical protein